MKLQWFRHTLEVIIFLDYCWQNSFSCSKKSQFSKKKIIRNTKKLEIS